MKIKVNDEVLVITGKDKGKSGKVLKTLKKDNKDRWKKGGRKNK